MKNMKKMMILFIGVFVFAVGMAMLLYSQERERLYGKRKIVRFPFERVKELPEEPNWYEENVFDDIKKYQGKQKELQEWFEKSYEKGMSIVNKNGDPIPLRNLRKNTIEGLTFFQNNGNLVVISSDFSGALLRVEVLEESIQKEEKRYCCIVENLVYESDPSYIDYKNDHTLYYYIDDGKARMQQMDEGVSKIKGFFSSDIVMYPLFIKDDEIYTYILEDAQMQLPDQYSYKTPKKAESKKVLLKNMQGTCEITISESKKIARVRIVEVTMQKDDFSWIYIKGEGLKNIREGEYEVQEALELLHNPDISIIEEVPNKQYVYLDRKSGYAREDWLW